ncbi:sigma 54-interacting transcriptional regulator [Cytobacillus sp. IB215316]|uniref:sigma 54-interacting transcriptional regulator n=1 Tax=Cytobacillus sp. IB215316 TaxID=3097354 RepID=UPI002A0CCCA1|nr:sigma 54-interacting transcriptional regulator [Cytobacillus sp. IB215316]MDX8360086.1 sigma 54-interacting transcriptional regulator [Cytobacillus sp. IB215316]
MLRVTDIMTKVEEFLYEHSSISEAIDIMRRLKWNTIPVCDNNQKLVGVFTRSILYKQLLNHINLSTTIGDFIRKEVYVLPTNTPYEKLYPLTLESKVGTAVVIDESSKVVGLVTKTDLVVTFLQSSQYLTNQLEKILETSQLGACMTDENGYISYVNEQLCTIFDLNEQDVLHEDVTNYLPKHYLNDLEKKLPKRMTFNHHHTIVRVSTYNLVNGKKGYIALFQNVTEIEQIAQELETVKKLKRLVETAIDNAYDGILMINEEAKIVFFNSMLCDLFELDSHHIKNQHVDQILPHFNLQEVMKTGVATVSKVMKIKGIKYMLHRIPVYQDNMIIGAIGKISFRQLKEVQEQFRKIDQENKTVSISNHVTETSRYSFDHIITRSANMEKLIRSVRKAAKGKSTILVRGESGTGKELFAHAIHSVSMTSNGPFVTVNCAAIPEHLLESEFFGYEAGAFTGAKQKGKYGKFDHANEGTLFLDEVGDMSLQLQAKLLRVLQEKEFYRVGGNERVQVNVRIIAATNRPLENMVESGEFREDLYYRLNVISFEVPPLRKRQGDILILSDAFIDDLNQINGTSITGIDDDAKKVMLSYDWPGNIRELRNVIERGMVFAEHGKIEAHDLPDYLLNKVKIHSTKMENSMNKQALLDEAEMRVIKEMMEKVEGNKTKAAKMLGISRSLLYKKLEKYQLM